MESSTFNYCKGWGKPNELKKIRFRNNTSIFHIHPANFTFLTLAKVMVNMGYEIGAIKYFIGMLTSVGGVITAYLFAQGLLHPWDYVKAFGVVLSNFQKPEEMIQGLVQIFVTTPSEIITLVLVGLSIMTVLWYTGSKFE